MFNIFLKKNEIRRHCISLYFTKSKIITRIIRSPKVTQQCIYVAVDNPPEDFEIVFIHSVA